MGMYATPTGRKLALSAISGDEVNAHPFPNLLPFSGSNLTCCVFPHPVYRLSGRGDQLVNSFRIRIILPAGDLVGKTLKSCSPFHRFLLQAVSFYHKPTQAPARQPRNVELCNPGCACFLQALPSSNAAREFVFSLPVF